MALTAAQIVDLACQVAKAPGYKVQAGRILNSILSDLCQTYDLSVARKTYSFTFDTSAKQTVNGATVFGGPMSLPADFLRCPMGPESDAFYMLNGVPMPLMVVDLEQFDMMTQIAGNQAYPSIIAINMSPNDSGPQMWFWPAPSAALPATVRYYAQMPDIAAPETSATVPWFPNSTFLKTRLAGELMQITDDVRSSSFLGDGPDGAQGILDRFLKQANNKAATVQRVRLDPQRFGRGRSALPMTKQVW